MERRLANPLLVQGLSAETSSADARRALRRMAIRVRLGECSRTRELVRAMEDEIEDPIRFLRWSILTPSVSGEVEARFRQTMEGYEVGLRSCVLRLRTLRSLAGSPRTLGGRHTLGVLYLHEAWFRTASLLDDQGMDRVALEACLQAWGKSLRLLGPPLNSESYWATIRRRARDHDDARLTETTVTDLRRGMLGEVIAPLGGLIQRALQSRQYQLVDVIGELLRKRGALDHGSLGRLQNDLAGFLRGLERRFRELEEKAERFFRSTGSRSRGLDLARGFEARFSREIKVITRNEDLFGSDGRVLRDQMANWLDGVAVHAFNEHQDGRLAKKMIAAALKIVDSKIDERRLKRNLETIQRFTGACWD